jgi:hypothetical protein
VAANSITRNPDSAVRVADRGRVVQGGLLRPGSAAYFATPAFSNGPITARHPGARPTQRTAVTRSAALPQWARTRRRRARTGRSTRAETCGSGQRRSQGPTGGSAAARSTAGRRLEASASGLDDDPLDESADLGFRVVPEPDAVLSLVAGAAALLALGRASQRSSR